MDYFKESVKLHAKLRGKLEVIAKKKPKTQTDLSLLYTPGVAQPCLEIAKDKSKVYDYTMKWNSVAEISDGSRVLGLGNIGAEASLPVLEGKCVFFKEYAGIDAFPIAISTQDKDEIITIVKNIAPVFGAINLEDIEAPKCFEIYSALQDIGIPVFHDDQYGTAIVARAGLLNAAKALKKDFAQLSVVVNGAGAAGSAIAKMLSGYGMNQSVPKVKDVVLCDTKGILSKKRSDLNSHKMELLNFTNSKNQSGSLIDAVEGADVLIGASTANAFTQQMVKSMNSNAIVFALANPIPEILPLLAKKAGAAIVATGRSDFPNQVNNFLGFPGIFRGALDARATRFSHEMNFAAADAIAKCIPTPTLSKILPSTMDKKVVPTVATAVRKAAISSGVVRQ